MNSCVILLVLFASVATFASSAQPTATVTTRTRNLPTFRLFGTPARTPSTTPFVIVVSNPDPNGVDIGDPDQQENGGVSSSPSPSPSASATPRPAPPHTDPTFPSCENRSLGTTTTTIPNRRRLLLDGDTGNVSGITLTLPRLLGRVSMKTGMLQKMVSYTHKHARLRSESSYNLDMLEYIPGDMIYQGGPIMTGCPINLYTIFYGDFPSSTIDILQHFLSNFGNSSYWRITSKFYDFSTTVGPLVRSAITHNTDYPYTTNININDIEGMIQRAIDYAIFPSDENGLYLVLTGPGILIDYNGFQFCTHFCGFHKIYDYPSNNLQQLKIAMVGYPDESCYYNCDVKENSPNFDRPADFMVRVVAHELAESVTDPFGVLGNIAWTDEIYYEISDKCAYTYGDVYLSSSERGDFYHNVKIGDRFYLLQQLWRVSIQGCGLGETNDEISEPTPTESAPTPTESAPTPTESAPTPTDGVTPTEGDTPTDAATPTEGATSCGTPTPSSPDTPSSSGTPMASETISRTPTRASASQRPSRTGTPTRRPSQTFTPTRRPSASMTFTQRPTRTSTPTRRPSQTFTPTRRPSASRTFTPTQRPSQTFTPTQRPSRTFTPTQRPSRTSTPSQRPSRTPTPTQRPSRTFTPSRLPSATRTSTRGRSATKTPTQTSTDNYRIPAGGAPLPVPLHTDPTWPGCENRTTTLPPPSTSRRRALLTEEASVVEVMEVLGVTLTVPMWIELRGEEGRGGLTRDEAPHVRTRAGPGGYNLDMLYPTLGNAFYNGGPILTGCPVNIYSIYFGEYPQESKDLIDYFVSHLGNSSYWKMITAYHDHTTTVGPELRLGASVQSTYPSSSAITAEDVEGILKAAIDANDVPVDENGIYQIFTGPGIAIDFNQAQFCVHFCGIHTALNYSNAGLKLKITVIGWPDESCYYACDVKDHSPNGDRPTDAILRVAAHEITESSTDPEGPIGNVAWTDENGYEMADKCAYTYGHVSVGTFDEDNTGGDFFYYNTHMGDKYFLLQQLWRLPTQDCGLDNSPSPATEEPIPTTTEEATPTEEPAP